MNLIDRIKYVFNPQNVNKGDFSGMPGGELMDRIIELENQRRCFFMISVCLGYISSKVATLPVHLELNGKQVENDKRFNQFMTQPNPNDDFLSFIQASIIQLLIHGTLACRYDKNALTMSKKIEPIYWLLTKNLHIFEKTDGGFEYPVDYYTYWENGQDYKFYPEDIGIARKLVGLNGRIKGESAFSSDPYLMELQEEVDFNTLSSFKKNGNSPGMVTFKESPDPASDAGKRFMEQVQDMYSGKATKNNLLFVPDGSTFTPLKLSPADLETAKIRGKNVADIIQSFQLNPILFDGYSEHSTFNNLETATREAYENCILPTASIFYGMISNYYFPEGYEIVINEKAIRAFKVDMKELEGLSYVTEKEKRSMALLPEDTESEEYLNDYKIPVGKRSSKEDANDFTVM